MSASIKSYRKTIEAGHRRRLLQAGFSAALAFGFALSPFTRVASAGEITRVTPLEGENANLMQNGTANIYAEAISAERSIGLNRFTKFSVDNGEIANLFFKQANGTIDVNTLVNMVNSRIDVYGTVNGIRNSKIGGNLFFLSPEGMVVGASGAINAGSLTVMTPNEDFFKKAGFYKAETSDHSYELHTGDIFKASQKEVEGYLALNGQYLAAGKMASVNSSTGAVSGVEIPINAGGTISVEGKINAQTAARLAAGTVNVGKDGGSAAITTGVVFDPSTYAVKENERMELQTDANGNLYLADASDADGNIKGDGSIRIEAQASATNSRAAGSSVINVPRWEQDEAKASVTVGKSASISAVGNVSLSSEASLTDDLATDTLSYTSQNAVADTTVLGKVSGKDVSVTATATSKATGDNNATLASFGEKVLLADILPNALEGSAKGAVSKFTEVKNLLTELNADAAQATAEANVTIGETAELNSTGDTVLKSEAKSTVNLALALEPDLNPSQESVWSLINGGFIWEASGSKANVNVEGKVNSGGDLKLNADAVSSDTISLTIKTPSKQEKEQYKPAFTNAAVGLINADSFATVNIGDKAELTAAKDASVKANNKTSIKSDVGVASDENEFLSTAVNVINANTGATVTDAGKILGQNVEIGANNTYDKLQVKTDNAFGKDDPTFWSKYIQPFKKVGLINAATSGVYNAVLAMQDKNAGKSGAAAKKTEASWNNYFDLGASVSVVNLTNDAKVDMKSTGDTKATAGDVNVSAGFTMADNSVKTLNRLNAASKSEQYAVSAAIGIENVTNNAEVNIESGSITANAAKETGDSAASGNINITAKVDNDYKQLSALLEKVEKAKKALSDYVSKSSEIAESDKKSILDKLKESESKWAQLANDINLLRKGKSSSEFPALISSVQSDIRSIRQAITGKLLVDYGDDFLAALIDLADPENYATMQVAATANSKGNAAGMLAGTVGVQNIDNISGVAIADGVMLTAGKDVKLASDAKGGNLIMAGKYSLLPQSTSEGADNALGGTVAVQNASTESSIKVGSAVISAGEGDFSAKSATSAQNTGIVTGGSTAGTVGITGMVSYLGGTAKSNTAIDTGAALEAKAVDIGADTNAVITGMAGDLSSSKATSVGASVSVISYDQIAAAKTVASESAKDWSAEILNVDAKNSGIINNLTIAGVSAKGETAKKGENTNNESSASKLDIRNDKSDPSSYTEMKDLSVNAGGRGNGAAAQAEPAVQADNDNKKAADQGKAEKKEDSQKRAEEESKVQVALAGSVSWNDVKTETTASLEGVKLQMKDGGAKTVSVSAEDASYAGAYSGAMALTQAGSTGKDGFSAALSGAVAANDLLKNTSATIKNAAITSATDVSNTAQNTGAQVAAGVSLGAETGDRSSAAGFDLAGSASINLVDSTVKAEVNNLTQDAGALKNIAYDKDVQVAGAISADYAKSSAAIGASVTVQKVKNDIEATIAGSKLGTASSALTNVQNLAQSKLTQVAGALSTGIVPASGSRTYVAANAAIAINDVDNNIAAMVDNSEIYTQKFSTEAGDGKLSADTVENEYLTELKDMKDSGGNAVFDLEGKAFETEAAEKGAIDVADAQGDEEGGDKNAVKYKVTEYKTTNAGNRIIAGAMSLTDNNSQQSGAALGAGVAYSTVDNDFTAALKGSSVTVNSTDAATVKASSDTLIVDAAAGTAVKTGSAIGAALAGSGAVSTIYNDTQALVENSTITANKLDLTSETKSRLITAAGELGAATSNAAAGLAYAQNNIENTVKATAKGLTLDGQNAGPTLNIASTNNSSALAVAGAANANIGDASLGLTATGAYAGNVGKTDTEATLETGTKTVRDGDTEKTEDVDTTIGTDGKKANGVYVKATDESSMKGIAGDLSVTGGTQTTGVSLGGAVVNNLLGEETSKGKVRASISDATINMADKGALMVETKNTAKSTAIAAGGAVAAGTGATQVSAQGSVAITKLYTDTSAELLRDNIMGGRVYVAADSSHDVFSTADGLAVSAGSGSLDLAAAGAGSKVVSAEDVSAKVEGGSHDLRSEVVKADSTNKIKNIAVGASVGASSSIGGAATGSVAANTIAGKTESLLSAATVKTTGSVGVLATSADTIKNYGGALSVGASGNAGAALGATVVVNNLTGETTATVKDSELTAEGKLHAVRVDGVERTGLAVNAKSTRDLTDLSLTGGVGGAGIAGIAAQATVANNEIAGKTYAGIVGSNINKELTASSDGANVFIQADDKTTASLNVGTLAVGAGGTAGAAALASVDSNTVSRAVLAEVKGTDKEKKTLKADTLDVKANSSNKIELTETGVSAGASVAGVGATGVVVSDEFTDKTQASLENMEVKAKKAATISADSQKEVKSYTNAIGLSGGVGSASLSDAVVVIKEAAATRAAITDTDIEARGERSAPAVSLTANNSDSFTNEIANTALAVSLGGASGTMVNVNNFKNTVETSLINSKLGSDGQALGRFTDTATNSLTHSFNSGAASAGLGAKAIGVSVNTIDSGTMNTVQNSTVYAKDIAIKAEEQRNVKQTAVNADAGLGTISVNVAINNVGTAVADTFSEETEHAKAVYKTQDIENTVDKALGDVKASDDTLHGGLFTDDSVAAGQKATFDRGGDGKGVHTNLAAAKLYATNDVTLESHSANNFDAAVVGAGVSAVAVNVNVATANVDTNTGISLDGSTVKGANVTLNSLSDGEIKQSLTQGNVSGLDTSVLLSTVTRTGDNKIDIAGSSLTAGKTYAATDTAASPKLSISALDSTRVQNSVAGYGASLAEIGVLVGKAYDYASTALTISGGSALTSESYQKTPWSYQTEAGRDTVIDYGDGTTETKTGEKVKKDLAKPVYGDVNLSAESANYIENNVKTGAFNAANVSVAVSKAIEGGDGRGLASVAVEDANAFKGKNINVSAKNSSAAKATISDVDTSLVSVGTVQARALAAGGADVKVAGGQTFTGEAVNITSNYEAPTNLTDFAGNSVTANASADISRTAVTAADMAVPFAYSNTARAEVTSKANLSIEGGQKYQGTNWAETSEEAVYSDDGKSVKKLKVEAPHEEIVEGGVALTAKAQNEAKTAAAAKNTTVSALAFASNTAETVNSNTATLKLTGAGEKLASLTAYALSTGSSDTYANGDGGSTVAVNKAAAAEHTGAATAQLDLTGSFEVADGVKLNAMTGANDAVQASSLLATLANASYTSVDNTVNNKALINVKDAQISAGGDVSMTASNQVTFNEDKDYALKGNGFATVSFADVGALKNTVNTESKVKLTGSTSIDSDGSQVYGAQSDHDIKSSVYTLTAGVAAGGAARNTLNLTTDNAVSADSGVNLKTNKWGADLTLAATDSETVKAKTVSEVIGAVGLYSSSDTKNTITRKNTVTADGTLKSLHDVNLYAGQSAEGELGRMDLDTSAEAYNKAAITLYVSPTLSNIANQYNKVNVGGTVKAAHDVSLYADAGKETVDYFSGTYTFYGGGGGSKYIATKNGVSTVPDPSGKKEEDKSYLKTADNKVTVDGSVTAGTAKAVNITIGKEGTNYVLFTTEAQYQAAKDYYADKGKAVPANYFLVVSDDEYSKAVDTSHLKKLSDIISIDNEDAGISLADFKVGVRSYAESRLSRLNELVLLMASYSGGTEDKDNAAYQGYAAEYDRLYSELKTEGIIGESGNVLSDIMVNYVEIPDLVASGGSIYVQTDNLTGEGSLRAEGSPTASITNNTSLATNVNNITVGDAGGVIYYRDRAMDTGSGQTEAEISAALTKSIRAANKNAALAVPMAYAAKGANSEVTIKGNNAASSVYYRNSEISESNPDISMPIMADIIVNGTISAEKGTVTIESKQDNITIEGKSVKDAAGIVADTVVLKADGGSIAQGQIDGIYNVGGDPQSQYSSAINKSSLHTGTNTINTSKVNFSASSEVAGKNVYINASDVNVNGAIQSGFARYFAEINPNDKLASDYSLAGTGSSSSLTVAGRLQEIEAAHPESGLDNSVVMGNPAFLLIKGGSEKNSSGIYEYRTDIYYNPSTGEMLVQDIESGGGTVSIVGRISSTGGGSIRALDGASDIDVTSTVVDKTLRVGKLVTNDVTGRITLTDTAQGLKTEYTRDDSGQLQVKTTDLKGQTTDKSATTLSADGKTAKYNPLSGQRYNWTTGDVTAEKKTYRHTWYDDMWGWSWFTSKQEVSNRLIKQESETTPISSSEKDTSAMRNGAYIGTAAGAVSGDTLDVIYSRKENYTTRDVTGERHWSQGFFGCHKYTELTWDTKTGTTNTYVASVKADNPIDIGFIGTASGDSKVTVSAKSDVTLTGDIGNKSLYTRTNEAGDIAERFERGSVNIQASGGSILGAGGSIYGREAEVSATGSMTGLSFTAGDEMNLKLGSISKTSGSEVLDFEQDSATTLVDGEREIEATIKSNREAKGNVVLEAAGAKENGAADTDLIEITNTGNTGSITTKANETAAIIADKINLVSENGAIDAVIEAGQTPLGSDTLSASVSASAKSDITLTQRAGDMRVGRVYSTDGDVTLNVPEGSIVDALEYRSQGVDNEGALLDKWLSAGIISAKDGETSAESADMQAEKTALLRKLDKEAKEAEGKTQTEAEANAINYEAWDRDLLLYSIQESIINQTSDTLPKTSTKDPNVKGNSITLHVRDSAGLNSPNTTTMAISTLGDATKTGASEGTTGLDDLKLLSRADASTVIWDSDNDKITISKVLPIGVQLNADSEGKNLGAITVKGYEENTQLAGGNAYIEGRTNAEGTGSKDLYIQDISVKGNAMVHSLGGIYNAADVNNVTITAASLDLTAAAGSIGTAEKALRTNITGTYNADAAADIAGTLRAVSTGGIYIENDKGVAGESQNDLYIRSMSSGGDIVLTSKGNIYSAKSASDVDGVIQVENDDKTITVTSKEGDIGSVQKDADGKVVTDSEGMSILGEKALRIRDNAKQVNLSAKNVYVNVPAQADGTTGTLNVTVNTAENAPKLQNLGIKSKGTINIMNEGDLTAADTISLDTAKALTVDKNLTAGEAVKLRSGEALTVNSELTASGNAGEVLLISKGGNLSVNEAITAGKTVTMSSSEDIAVNSKVAATGNEGKIDLTASGAITEGGSGLLQAAELMAKAGGLIDLTSEGNTLKKATLDSAQTETQEKAALATTGGVEVSFTNSKAADGKLTGAAEITNHGSGDITLGDNLSSAKTVTIINEGGGFRNEKAVSGDEGVTITTKDALSNSGGITSTAGGVSLTSADSVTTSGAITAAKDVTITAKNALMDTGSITSTSGGVALKSEDSTVTIGESAPIDAAKDIAVTAKAALEAKSDIKSAEGNVTLDSAADAVNTTGAITSEKESVLITAAKALTNSGAVTADKGISLTSKTETVTNSGVLNSKEGNIALTAVKDIVNTGAIKGAADVTIKSTAGAVNNSAAVNADSILIKAAEELANSGALTAAKNVTLSSDKAIKNSGVINGESISLAAGADLTNEAELKATKAVTLEAGTTLTNKGEVTAAKDVKFTSNQSIDNSGKVTGAGVSFDANTTLTNSGALTSQAESVALTAGTALANSGAVTAAKDVSFTSTGDSVINKGAITATGGRVGFTSAKDITNSKEVTAAEDVSFAAGDTITNSGAVTAEGGNVDFTAAKDITNSGAVESETDGVTLKADDAITLSTGGNITAAKNITAKGASFTNGSDTAKGATLTSGENISITTTGDLTNYGDMEAGDLDVDGNISLKVTNSGTLTLGSVTGASEDDLTEIGAGGSISIENAGGSVINGGAGKTGADVIGLEGVSIIAADGIQNSGLLGSVDGDVTLEVTRSGVLENAAGGDIIAVDGDITLLNSGDATEENFNIKNAGDLMTLGGKIKLESANGSIQNSAEIGEGSYEDDELTDGNSVAFSTGSIEILAENGSIENTHDLVAYGDDATEEAYVKLVAKDNITNGGTTADGKSYGYNVYARDDISITSTEGSITNRAVLESLQGDVKLTAEKGSIENVEGADIATLGGNVELTAKGDIKNTGDLIAINANADGDKSAGTVKLVSTEGNIENTDVFSKSSTDTGKTSEDYTAHDGEKYDVATQNIYLSARNGSVTNTHELVALGDVTLEAKTGLDNFSATIYAGGDITLTATDGALVNKAELYSVEGDVNLNAEKGTVVNALGAKVIAESGSVNMTAGGAATEGIKYIDVADGSTGTVTMSGVTDGVLVTEKFYQAADGSYKQIGAETKVSSLTADEKTSIVTVFSYLDSSGNKVYPVDTSVTDSKGNTVELVEINAADGTKLKGIKVDAEAYHEGDVINRGDVVALGEGGINFTSKNSNVENYDTFDKVDGEGEFTRKGDTYFNEGTVYDKDETFYFDGTGHALVSVGDISLNAANGYIYNGLAIATDGTFNAISGKDLTSGVNFGDITAAKDVNIISTGGNVNFTKDAEISAGNDIIVAGKEDVNIESGGSLSTGGSLSIAADSGSVNAAKADFNVKNGSLAITSASGDVSAGSASAKDVVSVGAGIGTNGTRAQSVVVGKLSGSKVILFNDSVLDGAKLQADTIEARESLVLRGDDISAPNITRGGAAGTLNAVVTGAGGGLVKNDLNLAVDGDVRFSELALTNGRIAAEEGGTLMVDNLRVGGKAELTALGFRNVVYGSPAAGDGAAAVFYTDGSKAGCFDLDLSGMAYSESTRADALAALGSKLSNMRVAGFGSVTGEGLMNLYIYAPTRERSNGILLEVLPHYNVESQRYSQIAWGGLTDDMYPIYPYSSYFKEKLGHFYRYNLYEMTDCGAGESFVQDDASEEELESEA